MWQGQTAVLEAATFTLCCSIDNGQKNVRETTVKQLPECQTDVDHCASSREKKKKEEEE